MLCHRSLPFHLPLPLYLIIRTAFIICLRHSKPPVLAPTPQQIRYFKVPSLHR